ncbi:hypothetical protein GGX14DRAFT_571413 [Mycena pura]|uniref:Uncharacterized protein n=1 Tax=Mycena pura TaxID=153505 RepID=A0AAD6V360_9AGAR|nr:hypothetical protein GGX14DRAFT_571413 [Mycena pura]
MLGYSTSATLGTSALFRERDKRRPLIRDQRAVQCVTHAPPDTDIHERGRQIAREDLPEVEGAYRCGAVARARDDRAQHARHPAPEHVSHRDPADKASRTAQQVGDVAAQRWPHLHAEPDTTMSSSKCRAGMKIRKPWHSVDEPAPTLPTSSLMRAGLVPLALSYSRTPPPRPLPYSAPKEAPSPMPTTRGQRAGKTGEGHGGGRHAAHART